jgi:hypothetical protein
VFEDFSYSLSRDCLETRWAGPIVRLSVAPSAEKVLIRPVPQARVTP